MTTPDPACNGEGVRIGGYGNREVSCEVCEGTGEAGGGDALRGALARVVGDCKLAADALGNSPAAFNSVRKGFEIIGKRASQALALNPPTESVKAPEGVERLTQPWSDYHGDLPDYDHPLRCVFESGVQYTVELLAKKLGVPEWTPCDGTEEYDGDLGGTLMNIVLEALPKDEHGDPIHPRDLAAPPIPADDAVAKERERAAQIAECAFDDRPRSRVGHPSQMDWEDGFRDGTRAAAAAIHSSETATDAAKPKGGA